MMHLCGQHGSCYSSPALGSQLVPSAEMVTSGISSIGSGWFISGKGSNRVCFSWSLAPGGVILQRSLPYQTYTLHSLTGLVNPTDRPLRTPDTDTHRHG